MAPWLSMSRETPHVGDRTGHRRRRRGEWAGEERSTSLALPSLEVAIAGAHRAFPRRELVAVHGDAHRATCFAPFGARFLENTVEPFGFCLTLHVPRSRNDEHPHSGR